jgi:hypothetical protein
VARRLNGPLSLVLPVSLCPLPGPLYSALLGYKEPALAEARHRHLPLIDDLFCHFLTQHRRCLESILHGPVDVVLPVPSTQRRGGSPLERVPGLPDHVTGALSATAAGGAPDWCPELLLRTSVPIAHMRPDCNAFVVRDRSRPLVDGARVLLLDDTYVSGSRAQSAAVAFRSAGARSVLIVPLGRTIRPDRLEQHAVFLTESRNRGEGCARGALCQRAAGTASG